MSVFNKTFFHFALGFVAIVVVSLIIVFSLNLYSTPPAGDNLAAPTQASD